MRALPVYVKYLKDDHSFKYLSVIFLSYVGRYFACSTHALAVNVFAKRPVVVTSEDSDGGGGDQGSSGPSFMYYVNDGIYGSFNCIMFDHYTVVPSLLQVRRSPQIITNSRIIQLLDVIQECD